MRAAVAQSEEKFRILVCCQVALQENIKIKANSLYIDEVVCNNLRKPVIIHNFWEGSLYIYMHTILHLFLRQNCIKDVSMDRIDRIRH